MSRLTHDALLGTYAAYGTPRERWRVGGEYERAVLRSDGSAVGYFDPDGIRWILGELAARTGWTPHFEGENPIALSYSKRGDLGPWIPIARGLPNTGFYLWKVPAESFAASAMPGP
jgi:gamma-glutamylcysteine synthetase